MWGFGSSTFCIMKLRTEQKKIIFLVHVLQKHKNQTHQTLNQEIQENRKGFLFLGRNEER